MIRGFIGLLIRRLLQRVIDITLGLFLLFGLRFDPVRASMGTTQCTGVRVRRESDGSTSSEAVSPASQQSIEVSKRAAAILTFLCLRLPLLLGGEAQSKTILRHYVAPTGPLAAEQLCRTRIPCGAVLYGREIPVASSGAGAIVVVGSPWDNPKELETLCVHLAVSTHRSVVLALACFSHNSISVHDAANSVLFKMVSAAQKLSCASLTLVASSFASSIVLHAALRAPLEDSLPPIRGILFLDPMVSLGAVPENINPSTSTAGASSETLGLDAVGMKKLLVSSAAAACCGPPSTAIPTSLFDWFPPVLDDAFNVPILIVYDDEGLWTQEMIAYFSKWSGCSGLVEGLMYQLPSRIRRPNIMRHSDSATRSPSSVSSPAPNMDVICSHMTLWLAEVSRGLDDDVLSSRPLSACSTPWANYSRSRPLLYDPHQQTSVDSMDGVFSRFPHSSSVPRPVHIQYDSPPYIPRVVRPNCSCKLSTPQLRSPPEEEGCGGLQYSPLLWKPPHGESLPRVGSSGLHLDSLDCHPHSSAVRTLPSVCSRSLASDDALGSTAKVLEGH